MTSPTVRGAGGLPFIFLLGREVALAHGSQYVDAAKHAQEAPFRVDDGQTLDAALHHQVRGPV
jgi:hypothetical protein